MRRTIASGVWLLANSAFQARSANAGSSNPSSLNVGTSGENMERRGESKAKIRVFPVSCIDLAVLSGETPYAVSLFAIPIIISFSAL
ncbi:hypothetical protein D3C71_1875660 [compost metagenome]